MFDGKGNFEQVDCVMLSGGTRVGSYTYRRAEALEIVILNDGLNVDAILRLEA